MKLDNFFKLLAKLPVDDYVIRLKLKYDHEKDYSYTNELLLYDGSDYEGSIYHWDNDWDEGQQDVMYMMLFGGYALGEAQARIAMELQPNMSAADRSFWKAMQDPKTYTNTDPEDPPYLVEDEEAEDD